MMGTATALIAMGVLSAGSKAAGAVMESRATNKASKAQQSAAQDSNRVARSVYQDQMSMMSPFREAGTRSMNLLGSLMLPSGDPNGYQPGRPIPGAPPPSASMPPPQGPGQAVPRGGPWGAAAGMPMPQRRPMGAPPMQPGPPPPQQMPPMPPQSPFANPWSMIVGQPNQFQPRY